MQDDDRLDGIGGSEIGDLANEPPYGCSRRLCYQKMQIPPDIHDVRQERLLKRGHALEPLIVSEYRARTGRTVYMEPQGQKKRRHPKIPYFFYHRDALMPKHLYGRTSGNLECKSMNYWRFISAERKGIDASYLLQIQWGMMIDNKDWGAFAVLWPDGWELLHWDVQRDRELGEQLMQMGHLFWEKFQKGQMPNRLLEGDHRCYVCLWRYTCWQVSPEDREDTAPTPLNPEIITDESLLDVTHDCHEMEQIMSGENHTLDAIRNELRRRMGDREIVKCGGYLITYRRGRPRKKLIPEKLMKDYPRIYELCCINQEPTRQLRIYELSDK